MLEKVLIGLTAGFISGLFGAGGGMFLVPAYIHFLKLDEKEARATSVFSILPMAIVSMVIYLNADFLNCQLVIKCAIGGIIGGIIGSKILKKIKDEYLKISFIAFLLYASVKMFFS